ncbi:MAG: hypothetical protein HY868_16735 [Chloroflexi bacterium]|nr:hypothetical protein [Chloroflexota bacterium]
MSKVSTLYHVTPNTLDAPCAICDRIPRFLYTLRDALTIPPIPRCYSCANKFTRRMTYRKTLKPLAEVLQHMLIPTRRVHSFHRKELHA